MSAFQRRLCKKYPELVPLINKGGNSAPTVLICPSASVEVGRISESLLPLEIQPIESEDTDDEYMEVVESEGLSDCVTIHVPVDNLPQDHCAICLEPVENGTSIRVFDCEHDKYHEKCLKYYLVLSKSRAVRTDRPCPRCHAAVNTTYSELMNRTAFQNSIDKVCIASQRGLHCLAISSCLSILCVLPLIILLTQKALV